MWGNGKQSVMKNDPLPLWEAGRNNSTEAYAVVSALTVIVAMPESTAPALFEKRQ